MFDALLRSDPKNLIRSNNMDWETIEAALIGLLKSNYLKFISFKQDSFISFKFFTSLNLNGMITLSTHPKLHKFHFANN